MKKTVSLVVAIVATMLSLLLIVGTWGGEADPLAFPLAGVIVMTLPLTIPLDIVAFAVCAIWWRRSALILGVAIALSLPGIADVFPIGTPSIVPRTETKNDDARREFTLMTFNCSGWADLTEQYPGDVNPTARLILDTDADIVALQESNELRPRSQVKLTHEQIDSIKSRYPYTIQTQWRLILLSKFPVTEIDLGLASERPDADETTCYNIDIDGHRLTLFNIHLQSIGLTGEDKALYNEIVSLEDIDKDSEGRIMGRVRRNLVGKLATAGRERARQVERLISDIAKYGTGDVIICGDFNDVPGCHSLRRLEDIGFRQVYPAVGRGYMATFNRNKFWFRIDHVLWRGDVEPISMRRIETIASDHHALVTRFAMP